MKKCNLIIVLGEAATGKSMLADKIASNLGLPLICKDSIKTIMSDQLGGGDRERSREIGVASYAIMDYIITGHIKVRDSLVIEGTFHPEFANPKFQAWQQQYGFHAIRVYCHADDAIITERYKTRALEDKGHITSSEGEMGVKEFIARLKERRLVPLELRGDIMKVDTTDFRKVDIKAITTQVARRMR